MFRTAIILGNRKTKPNAVGAQFKKIKKNTELHFSEEFLNGTWFYACTFGYHHRYNHNKKKSYEIDSLSNQEYMFVS